MGFPQWEVVGSARQYSELFVAQYVFLRKISRVSRFRPRAPLFCPDLPSAFAFARRYRVVSFRTTWR